MLTTNSDIREIVFVDARVQDITEVLKDFPQGAEVVYLDAGKDGLEQMVTALGQRGDVGGVHILAHGSAGALLLGSTVLGKNLTAHSEQLAAIGRAMASDGDLLVYACDLGAGEVGAQFVSTLARLTGADVAASTDLTGATALGGNWTLEAHQGVIDTRELALAQYGGVLEAVNFVRGIDADETGADLDGDGSASTITKTVSGKTFVFSGGELYDYGSGLYPLASDHNSVVLTVTVQAGYIFDLNSVVMASDSIDAETLTISFVRADGTPGNVISYSLLNDALSRTYDPALIGVKSVTFHTDNAAYYSSLDISNVIAAPPVAVANNAVLSSDTGIGGDFITGVASQTISGTLSANLDVDAKVEVSYNNGVDWEDATSYTVGSKAWSASTTLVGSDTFQVRVTSASGASSNPYTHTYTLDVTVPTTSSVAVPTNGTYYTGDALDFTVNYNEAVTVGASGTPSIAVMIGAATRQAVYVSGSGTSALLFRYTVVNGDTDANGIQVLGLALNGSSITDAADNNASLLLNSISTTGGVNVDGASPSITNVSAITADGSYGAGQTITITVDFSGAVDVDTTGGTPTLALDGGGTASYTSGSGSTTLTFSYVVSAGQNSADLDYASIGALALNGATITDSGGALQAAAIVLTTPGTAGSLGANKDLVIDTTAPTTSVATVTFSADTGASSSDFITNTASQTISGTLSAALAAGESVLVSLDNGGTWAAAVTNVGSDGWALAGQTLSASNTLQVKVTDAAGNDGSVLSQAYVYDTAATVPTVATLSTTSLTPVLTGAATLAAGETMTVTVGGATYDVTPVAGAWSLDLAAAVPVSGTLTLALNQHYEVVATATDLAGNVASDTTTGELVLGTTPVTPTPPTPDPDPTPTPPTPGIPDNDGIPGTVEDQAPGIPGPDGTTVTGDGNGDGIKDSEQAGVASIGFVTSPTGESNPGSAPPTFTTLVASSQDGKVGSGNDNSRITSLGQKDAPQDLPEGMQMPIGLVSFTVELGAGKTGENFSLYLDPALGVNGYWKQDSTGTWVNIASEPYGGKMVMEGGRVRLDFHIEDGGQFDADGKVDGIITDPGAPGHMPLSITGQAPDVGHGFWF